MRDGHPARMGNSIKGPSEILTFRHRAPFSPVPAQHSLTLRQGNTESKRLLQIESIFRGQACIAVPRGSRRCGKCWSHCVAISGNPDP